MGITQTDLDRLAAAGKIRGYNAGKRPPPKARKPTIPAGRPSPARTVLNIAPFPKPRMTQRDKWSKRPVTTKYWAWVDGLKAEARRTGYEVSVPLSIIFWVPMPESWSKKKRAHMDGQPHTQRPDLDNYIKAFKDALLEEDSHVWAYEKMEKRWAQEGRIEIL